MSSRLNKAPQKVDVVGVSVSDRSMSIEQWPENEVPYLGLVTFVNPTAPTVADRNPTYAQMLKEFDWVLCDGIGMVWAVARIAGMKVDRQAFDLTSVARPVLSRAATSGQPIVMVGGKPGVSESARDALTELFEGLNVLAAFDGYEPGEKAALEFLRSNPDVILISGRGAVKQEELLLKARDVGWRGTGFTCGGFFDQVAKKVQYYPQWIDDMNLRFAWRLLSEPKRLWRRYLLDYPVFVIRALRSAPAIRGQENA